MEDKYIMGRGIDRQNERDLEDKGWILREDTKGKWKERRLIFFKSVKDSIDYEKTARKANE